MQYKIEVRPLATIEIIEAYDWYTLHREELGLDFLNELEIFLRDCLIILKYILTTKSLYVKAK
jgi:hypothetical protein